MRYKPLLLALMLVFSTPAVAAHARHTTVPPK
ncbi:putative metallopeptidase [Neisseria meningitidis]|nr:putative metallopeptidase [Neisseria meningitidis]